MKTDRVDFSGNLSPKQTYTVTSSSRFAHFAPNETINIESAVLECKILQNDGKMS